MFNNSHQSLNLPRSSSSVSDVKESLEVVSFRRQPIQALWLRSAHHNLTVFLRNNQKMELTKPCHAARPLCDRISSELFSIHAVEPNEVSPIVRNINSQTPHVQSNSLQKISPTRNEIQFLPSSFEGNFNFSNQLSNFNDFPAVTPKPSAPNTQRLCSGCRLCTFDCWPEGCPGSERRVVHDLLFGPS